MHQDQSIKAMVQVYVRIVLVALLVTCLLLGTCWNDAVRCAVQVLLSGLDV